MSCIKQKIEEPFAPLTTNQDFLLNLRETWQRPYTDSAFLKDIPRLVRRIKVQTSDGTIHCLASQGSSKLDAIVALLDILANDMGREIETVQTLRESVESGHLGEELSEEQGVSMIFEKLDHDGAIIKVLKMINQSTVLYAMSVLKEHVLRDIMTKDVRTPEGWQIFLRLGSVIQLTHLRMEQSVDGFGDQTNHFELQWEVMVTFDKNMEQLCACAIRILRLFTSPSMEPDMLHHLRNHLIEGLIII